MFKKVYFLYRKFPEKPISFTKCTDFFRLRRGQPPCCHPTFSDFLIFQKNTARGASFFVLFCIYYRRVRGTPKITEQNPKGRKTGKIDPKKHWKQPKWVLEGPKKALLGLFRPFQGLTKYGRSPEGSPKGSRKVGKVSRRVWKAFAGICESFGGRTAISGKPFRPFGPCAGL